MSDWALDGGADNSLLTWSSFDEIAWDEFGDNGDHIVPDNNMLNQTLRGLQDESREKLHQSSHNVSNTAPTGQLIDRDSVTLTSDGSVVSVRNGNDSTLLPSVIDPHVPDLKSMNHSGVSCKETSDLNLNPDAYEFQDIDGICNDYNDTGIVMGDNLCGFSLDDNDGGSLERNFNPFPGHQEDTKSDSLLELGWDSSNSLEYMDTMFRSSDTVFPQALSESGDAIPWSSFPSSSGSSLQPNMAEESSQSRGFGDTLKDDGDNMAFLPHDQISQQNVSSNSEKPLKEVVPSTIVQELDPHEQKSRLRALQRKRSEKRSRRLAMKVKLAASGSNESHQTGFGIPANHGPFFLPNSYSLSQHLLQPTPFFVGYHQPFLDPSKLQVVSKEMPSRLPSMSLQEKLEKLRWRQKMQAKMAVEYQQKQLLDQNILRNEQWISSSIDAGKDVIETSSGTASQKTGEINTTNDATVKEPIQEDGDAEAEVLYQLQSIMSKLETRTRICIRDALYRLAESATKRRMISNTRNPKMEDSQSAVSGVLTSKDETSSSKRILEVNTEETETNPTDRSIAYLLFRKQYSPAPSQGPLYIPSGVNGSSNPSMPPTPSWMWQTSSSNAPFATPETCQNTKPIATNIINMRNIPGNSSTIIPIKASPPYKIQSSNVSIASHNGERTVGSSKNSFTTINTDIHVASDSSSDAIQNLQQPKKNTLSKENGLDVEGKSDDVLASLKESELCNPPVHSGICVQGLEEQKTLQNSEIAVASKEDSATCNLTK